MRVSSEENLKYHSSDILHFWFQTGSLIGLELWTNRHGAGQWASRDLPATISHLSNCWQHKPLPLHLAFYMNSGVRLRSSHFWGKQSSKSSISPTPGLESWSLYSQQLAAFGVTGRKQGSVKISPHGGRGKDCVQARWLLYLLSQLGLRLTQQWGCSKDRCAVLLRETSTWASVTRNQAQDQDSVPERGLLLSSHQYWHPCHSKGRSELHHFWMCSYKTSPWGGFFGMHGCSGEKPSGHRTLNWLRSPFCCCDLSFSIPLRNARLTAVLWQEQSD